MDIFEELYIDFHHDVSLFLYRLTGYEKHLTEDLTQETFYQAILSFHRFKGNCHVKTWLCQIAKNLYLNSLRKEKKIKQVPIEEAIACEEMVFNSITINFENKELIEQAVKIIKEFDGKTRDVMIYRIFTDISYAEISLLLKINENSAKVIYMRGKEKLQNKLRKEYGYEI